MSMVIESATPTTSTPSKVPYALVEGVYQQVADNLWLKSRDYKTLIMHGTKGIELEDFQNLLTDEDRQIMQCNCCKDFFRKYSNLLAVTESGEVTSALFRDVKTSNQHAKALFNKLADIVESGKPSHFLDERLRGTGHQSVKIILGVKEAGGYGHYHGYIARQDISRKASFEDSVRGVNNLMSKYKGLDKLVDAMEAICPAFMQEDRISLTQREYFESFAVLLGKFRDAKNDGGLSTEHVLAQLWAGNVNGLSMILHFNGNVLGNLIENFLDSGDYEKAVSLFLERTDPLVYKARETDKVTKQQLEQAHKYIKENGYGSALIHSIAAPDEIEAIWRTTPVETPVEEEKSASDAADDLFAEKIAEVSKEQAKPEPKEIWPGAKNITRTDFVHRVLGEAERIWINMSGYEKLGILTAPTDKEAKPVFFWSAQRPSRPYVTCIPHERIPVGMYGFRSGYTELDMVAELPWFNEDIKMEGALSPGWMLCFAFEPVESVMYHGLQSFGGALKGDLQPYRLGIDSVVNNRQVFTRDGEKGTAYMQLSRQWEYRNVRVLNKDGSQSVYNIMDVD